MQSSLLAKIRKRRNETIREVESKTGLTSAFISLVENNKINKPDVQKLYILAQYYQLDYNAVLAEYGYPLLKTPIEE